ncbi:hypothetical protein CHELA40_13413 [Chelatococcus asaccharovorans]|nr:hypothetical protein CHELA40_13413 [Chelatococcus asaccharovorans]CAH1678189.1 hypothetical protein CHELA17_62206 [Chelatococcus asaccharovorans]
MQSNARTHAPVAGQTLHCARTSGAEPRTNPTWMESFDAIQAIDLDRYSCAEQVYNRRTCLSVMKLSKSATDGLACPL